MLRIIGKENALKDLEKAEALIREAHDILYRLPVNIHLETGADIKQHSATDSEPDSR